jgi:hypothetical protein
MSFILQAASPSGLTLLQTVNAANSATVDLDQAGVWSLYDTYMVAFDDVTQTAFNGNYLNVRFKIGGAFVSTAEYSRIWSASSTTGTPVSNSQNAVNRITLIDVLSNNAANACMGQVYLSKPASTTTRKMVNFNATCQDSNGSNRQSIYTGGGAFWGNTNAVEGLRFFLDLGNILTGNFRLYGLLK